MFAKKNIKDIPIEQTAHGSGLRKMIVSKGEISSPYLDAFTYGCLSPNQKWGLHKHDNIVEICLVIKGIGIIRDKGNNEEKFQTGDRFIFPANIYHEIENTSSEAVEFYFFRIEDKK